MKHVKLFEEFLNEASVRVDFSNRRNVKWNIQGIRGDYKQGLVMLVASESKSGEPSWWTLATVQNGEIKFHESELGEIAQWAKDKAHREAKRFGHKNLEEISESVTNESVKFKDLVDTRLNIEIGSRTSNGIWNQADLTEEIKKSIKHNLFDWDFYHNWTGKGEEYAKVFDSDVMKGLLTNIDKTLNDMFTFKGNKLTFNITGDEAQSWIDNWFQTNKSISKSLKQDYYDYRDEYAGVKLK